MSCQKEENSMESYYTKLHDGGTKEKRTVKNDEAKKKVEKPKQNEVEPRIIARHWSNLYPNILTPLYRTRR